MDKLIYDCNGSDFDLNIFSALERIQSFKLIAVTTVFGNQSVAKAAQAIQRKVDKNIPTGIGRESQLHEIKQSTGNDQFPQAIDIMSDILEQNECILIATGPLTNIATLILARPDLHKKIKNIIIIGGSIYECNKEGVAIRNFLADPEAASIVLENQIPKLLIPQDLLNNIENKSYPNGIYVAVIASLLNLSYPGLFTSKKYQVSMELESIQSRGYSVIDVIYRDKDKKLIEVMESINYEQFNTVHYL